ncbi:MAG TPA: NADH-quinone oxidoreductase subunit F, partial [bacterium]|nr:NADH-quinone oxidoreductase subunit F [bacterium]
GVPPLSGFGGKWMLYTALIEKGWYLQAGLAFFAGAVAFLYLFRLIHSIFLGQLKPEHRNIKESPIWYHIPSYIFIGGIMAISAFPNIILKPLIQAVSGYFPASITLENYTVISTLGYWNGNAVMLVTMGIFMTLLIFMLMRIRSVTKVEQFNIVYAAERPERPVTTHVAYNFFAPYKKALGFLDRSRAVRFWDNISQWSHTLAAAFNNIYTGNAQTYALHIFMLIVILYLIIGVH